MMRSDLAGIRELLDRVRARWRRVSLLRALARASLASASALAVALVLAPLAAPTPALLAALGVLAVLAASGLIVRALWPLRRPPGDAQLARFIEEREPALDDGLATAVDLLGDVGANGSGLAAPMVAHAARRVAHLDPQVIIPGRIVRTRAVQAVAAVAVLLGVMFAGRDRARESFDALAVVLFPSRVTLEVVPGNARVRPGASLTIEARLSGNRVPAVARVLRADPGSPNGGDAWQTTEMRPGDNAGTFRLVMASIDESFRYRVVAGPAVSPVFAVAVARPPRVARIDVEYVYPAALGLPPRTEEDGGDIYAPSGTGVRLRVRADGDAASGRLAFADGSAIELAAAPEGGLSGGWTVVANGSYRVALADRDGLENPGDTEYFIRTIDDRPPDVRIMRPARDRTVTPLEEVEVEAQADDDFGVERLDLVYSVRGRKERSVRIDTPRRATSVTGAATIYLEDLGVEPGDFVSYYVRARDLARGRRSTEARSDIFFLDVKPFEQAYTASDSQAAGGSGGASPPLDDLVQAQKQIIVATWKLDRRGESAGGARSNEDIRSVGRAEEELKTRVEETSSSSRAAAMRDPRRSPLAGRGGAPAPRPPRAGQTSPQEDAMTAAAVAMGRAVESLSRLDTGGAVAPELEALAHLLKAQGDQPKQQVPSQQMASGGGGNRSGQDMSSLFDRELQRQQQTNYETPTATDERKDANADLLDRIRDLAERQDELLRQQRDLSSSRPRMTTEELARELEKLTREQSDLRDRAEELSRRMAEQGRQNEAGQQGRQNRGDQQTAGSQSGRQNPSAGQQGQAGAQGRAGQPRASSQAGSTPGQQTTGGQGDRQMRDVSEEMRNAAGDLRRQRPQDASERGRRALEKLREIERQMQTASPDERRRARGDLQLEARQLADAERQLQGELGRLGQGDAARDGLRRLAGEQERLAERAERLRQGLDRQAATAGATDERDQEAEQAVAEASREFDRQRVDERMRQSADALREAAADGGGREGRGGAGGGSQASAARMAAAQQELARDLDRLADQLSAGDDGRDDESRKLSEQLDRAQELRQRLDELTGQLEALGRGDASGRGEPQPGAASGQASPTSSPGASLDRLRAEYERKLEETRDLLDELGRDRTYTQGGPGVTFDTPGRMTLSAPGTEAFKQDFSRWETLRRQATLALERAQLSISRKLQERIARDRLAAGADDKTPSEYQQQVDSYFKALANGRRP